MNQDPRTTARTAREGLAQGLQLLQTPGLPPNFLDAAEPIARAMGALHKIERGDGAIPGVKEQAEGALGALRDALSKLQSIQSAHPAAEQAMAAVAGSLGQVHTLAKLDAPAPPQTQHAYAPYQAPQQHAHAAAPQFQPPPAAPQFQAPPAAPQFQAPPAAPQFQAPPAAPQFQPPPAAPQFQPPPAAQQAHFQAAPPAATQFQAPSPAPQFQPPGPPGPPPRPATAPMPPHAPPFQPPAPPQTAPMPPPAAFQPPRVPGTAPMPPPQPQAAADPFGAPSGRESIAPPAGTIEAELGAHSPSNFYKTLSGNDIVEHGGIFVATYNIPKMGQRIQLRVHLPGGYHFDAAAVVRWTREGRDNPDAPPGFGAQFQGITAEQRQLIQRYVRNREPLFYDDL